MSDSAPTRQPVSLRQFSDHARNWRTNLYVYPVVSRRSGGVSIGINLNPDGACNFDCPYCQVDRTVAPRTRDVDLDVLRDELRQLASAVVDGSLFKEPEFSDLPKSLHRLNDFAFSGDGEPTTYRSFADAVRLAADVKQELGLGSVKMVLITDACYLTKPYVQAGLAILDENQGEIWAKLDAGTQAYYEIVNRPNFPLQHVIDNITAAARVRPIVIQAMFMRVRGCPPSESELDAFAKRLNDIVASGGQIGRVQVYTIARTTAEDYVTALEPDEVDTIVAKVSALTGLSVEAFYAGGDSTARQADSVG